MNSLEHHYGVIDAASSTPKWSIGGEHHFGASEGVTRTNNIETLRVARGWSRPELANRMGTSGQQVERLEKGQRKLTQEWMERAAKAFGVATTEIISDDVDTAPPPRSSQPDDDTVEIIQLDLSLSMGPGTLIEEFAEEEPLRLSHRFVEAITRTPSDRLRLVKGVGDSMEPTLRTGDRVMVDLNERQLARSHGVYWIDHLGTHGIKRLRASSRGKILVMSDNPLVPDYEVDEEDLRIEGRVIWFARDL